MGIRHTNTLTFGTLGCFIKPFDIFLIPNPFNDQPAAKHFFFINLYLHFQGRDIGLIELLSIFFQSIS